MKSAYNIEERLSLVRAAMGQEPFDLIIRNVKVLNVVSGELLPGVLGIKHGRIVTTQAAKDAETKNEYDGGGRFAVPGLIDTHVHVDSTLVTPEGLAELIVPAGTTCLLADPMEIANVAGIEGLKALLQAAEDLPYHIFVEVSSRVPTAPGLETTGGVLGLEEVKELLAWPQSVSLGELDPSKVLGLREEYFAKIQAAWELNKIANGHAIGLEGAGLDAYACAGLADDHECVTFEEARDRVRRGLAVLIREGSTERNLEALIKGLVKHGSELASWMFCTDDKHPDDIKREGHIDWMVRQAVALGLEPLHAVQLATINAARHFRLEQEIGSLTPGRWADIILVSDLNDFQPQEVFFKGKLVANKGRLLEKVPVSSYPDWLRHTVKVGRGRQGDHFALHSKGDSAEVRVIELFPDQIINREGRASLPVVDGCVQNDVANDVLKLSVVERHGKTGTIGTAFVHGFGLKQGALASSVSHDHHNIVIVGTNDDDMAACVRAVEETQGGMVAVLDGELLGRVELPLGGLLSEKPVDKVISELERLNESVRGQLGGVLPAPMMTLSFISLPTVPELGLTDLGLVDVLGHKLISVFVNE
ncbi:MAG: adenine deaminase [Anaerolineales bacterium]|nr:adenine deaminase [Anaerolineales bacterium]